MADDPKVAGRDWVGAFLISIGVPGPNIEWTETVRGWIRLRLYNQKGRVSNLIPFGNKLLLRIADGDEEERARVSAALRAMLPAEPAKRSKQ